jgi:hypothetical protein
VVVGLAGGPAGSTPGSTRPSGRAASSGRTAGRPARCRAAPAARTARGRHGRRTRRCRSSPPWSWCRRTAGPGARRRAARPAPAPLGPSPGRSRCRRGSAGWANATTPGTSIGCATTAPSSWAARSSAAWRSGDLDVDRGEPPGGSVLADAAARATRPPVDERVNAHAWYRLVDLPAEQLAVERPELVGVPARISKWTIGWPKVGSPACGRPPAARSSADRSFLEGGRLSGARRVGIPGARGRCCGWARPSGWSANGGHGSRSARTRARGPAFSVVRPRRGGRAVAERRRRREPRRSQRAARRERDDCADAATWAEARGPRPGR